MSIQALPQHTVRAIGASQVLTDPASVVKELVDNALDARATSIFVDISANTLDVLQVRDNGHGIVPEDRPLVAKRYCTSKIKDERDLSAIGGSSLGFRGEALSSAAEMSGSMTITTRVEGEDVANTLKVAQNGELAGQDRASHPIGTTVRITDFLKTHPVRKQVALKNTVKCLAKIKQILQAYAFARPATRLSLRVLKAKNDKGNWSYAPKPGANIEDTAFKVVGNACASQCSWSVMELNGFTAHAFLPTPDADASKISNVGQFISVDGRPMSTARGTPKQIAKLFKDNLKRASNTLENVKDPFLYLDLICPSEAYDANLEPAKDNVLFDNEESVLETVRRLFDVAYPANKQDRIPHNLPDKHNPEDVPVANVELSAPSEPVDEQALEQPSSKRRRTFRPNMYGCDEDELDSFVPQSPGILFSEAEETREAAKDVSVSNPFFMAKLNACARKANVTQQGNKQLLTPARQESSPARKESDADAPLSSPVQAANPTSRSPFLTPRASSPVVQSSGQGGFNPLNRIVGHSNSPTPELMIHPHAYAEDATSMESAPRRREVLLDSQMHASLTSSSDAMFVDQTELTAGTPLNRIPNVSPQRRSPRKHQQRAINKPFVSPVQDERNAWFDIASLQKSAPHSTRKNRSYAPFPDTQSLVPRGELGDLLDDPRPLSPARKNRDIRAFMTPGQTPNTAGPLDHTSRHPTPHDENVTPAPRQRPARLPAGFVRASVLDLEGPAYEERAPNAAVPDDEDSAPAPAPAPASRRRRTTDWGPKRAHRTRSVPLPLDRVPSYAHMQNVILRISDASTGTVQRAIRGIEARGTFVGWNEPALDAYDTFAYAISDDEMDAWTKRLGGLLATWYPEGEPVGGLGELVRTAFAGSDALQSSTGSNR